ncbi:CotH kinase family protein [Ruminococcus sp.]|uniref:CotH kinase family protein n=1 Tax=Ruminococcus sp. TaxID=41978 RepID=UPI002E75FDF0|nr:CotH kinase family protein [Ruminococcus sp.]MEE1262828.1 CotH kinase family protein [Ruminococcus sp.]
MKKIISLLLCAAVFAGLFCIQVNAAENGEAENGELTVPRVYVTTDEGNGNSIVKADGYVGASVKIEDVDGSVLEDKASFKVRGNSTALAEKKPFTFKFAKKKDVLGMGKGKKWALLANCFDPTLMRNYIAFDIARELDIDYTSNQKYVELWVDGVFKGCYTLMEPVQEGKDRVDIDIESNNGMKDFLIEYEYNRDEEGVTYIKSNGYRFALSEPEEPNEEQLAYIQEKVDTLTSAILSKNYETMASVTNIESFAKLYLVNEFVKNVDSNYSSVYYYYKDGVFYAGPPWDYDLASGNVNASSSKSYEHASTPDRLYTAYTNLFYHLMMRNEFREDVRKVYSEHYAFFKNIYSEGGLIDGLLAKYGDVFSRNFNEAGWDVSKRYTIQMRTPEPTFDENVSFLKNWYREHNAWLGNTLAVYGVNVRTFSQRLNDPHKFSVSVDILNTSSVKDLTVELYAEEPMYFKKTLTLSDAENVWKYTSRKNYSYSIELPGWMVTENVKVKLVTPDVTSQLEPQDYSIEIPKDGDAVELKVGDANLDGAITVDDATEIQKIAADLAVADDKIKAVADINADGAIDITEATKIQQSLAEICNDGYAGNIGKVFKY